MYTSSVGLHLQASSNLLMVMYVDNVSLPNLVWMVTLSKRISWCSVVLDTMHDTSI
jgi:hypothetical protein